MATINPNTLLDFAKTIVSGDKGSGGARLATVTRVDENGTAYVQLPGGEETPIATTGATYNIGDVISVTMFNGKLRATGNISEPSVSGRAVNAAFRPVQKAAELAKAAANEAAAVAAAINQHFWSDTNGAHVTDVTQDEWKTAADNNFSDVSDLKPYNNLLMNSLGILLRSALNNLVAITRSAIAFYDGAGNTDANITAQFGTNGAVIGKVSSAHSVIDANGQRFYGADGITQIANLGYGEGSGASGTSIAPYFTFGTRRSGSSIGNYSLANGLNITASGSCSRAGGYIAQGNGEIIASGLGASAEGEAQDGYSITASDVGSHAEGVAITGNIVSSGRGSHAEGGATIASGFYSHAEGNGTIASGASSHAEGAGTTASGSASHAGGIGTIAAAQYQTAIGRWNVEDSSYTYALIVGNGTHDANRSNAFAVDWDGNVFAKNQGKKILWSGASYMIANQTATLSENVSDQFGGIVLAWSAYPDGVVRDYDWVYTFVPKAHIANHDGTGVMCPLATANFSKIGCKYVYVSDGSISGNANNNATGTGSGITYANNYWVLRYVIGV